jgi:hypothetical protein
VARVPFDPAGLDPVDPSELDAGNVPHLHKHGFSPDDLYDVWVDPDAVLLPAPPGGGAHWLLVGD